jgi:PST family polysaccharide transporter
MKRSAPATLTRAATGGALWLGGSLALQVAIGLVSQVVLAAILTPHDFGLFALVISVSYLLSTVGNFGIRTLMAQRSLAEIGALRRPLLTVGVIAATLSGLLLIAMSPLVAGWLDEPDLRDLMLVAASTFVLKPYTAVAAATLQARLQFSRLATTTLLATISHYVVAIAMARAGMGALSLVAGLQVNAVVMVIVLWLFSRGGSPSGEGSQYSVRQAAALAKWPVAGEVAMDARLDYLAIRVFATTEVVGYYHFAFILVHRLIDLLMGVSRNVLFPTLSRIGALADRQAAGVVRAGTVLVAAGAAAAAGLIAAMFPIEEILWGGRWESAVPAMMLLASAAPVQAGQAAVEQLLKARALFRRWTGVMVVRSAGSALVALGVVAVMRDASTATEIAAAVGAFLVIEALLEVVAIGPGVGVAPGAYWRRVLPSWVVLVTTGWLVVGLASTWSLGSWAAAFLSLGLVGASSVVVAAVMWRRGLFARH